jgi:hypothetical protein
VFHTSVERLHQQKEHFAAQAKRPICPREINTALFTLWVHRYLISSELDIMIKQAAEESTELSDHNEYTSASM